VWGSRSIIILKDAEQNEFYEKNDINIWIYFIDRNRSWYIFFYKGIEMNKLIDRNRSWYIFFYKGIEMNKLIWVLGFIIGTPFILFVFGTISYYIQKWFFPDMLFKNEAMYEQFKHKMKKK